MYARRLCLLIYGIVFGLKDLGCKYLCWSGVVRIRWSGSRPQWKVQSLPHWVCQMFPCPERGALSYLYRARWKFHIWSVGYQNRVKRVIGVHFWKNFWKIFKNEDFGFDIFEQGQILMPFSGLATWKLIFSSSKNKGRLCVYRGTVWYYVQYGLCGGGVGKIAHGREG